MTKIAILLLASLLALVGCGTSVGTPAVSSDGGQAAKAASLYYQGYALVGMGLTSVIDAEKAYAEQIEEGWRLIDQAAKLGDAKAMRAMGVRWLQKGDLKMAHSLLEQAVAAGSAAAKYDLASMSTGLNDGVSSELLHAQGKAGNERANRLLQESAEAGYPPAIRAWCAQNIPSKPYDPSSPIVAKCREWMEVAAAQGDWQGWSQATTAQIKNSMVVGQAYGGGLRLVRGGFSGATLDGLEAELLQEHPFERCTHFLGQNRSRFLFIFNEQLCVPPRASFPKWRGIGKQFKAPESSRESQEWYEQGLKKLAAQEYKEGGALLKRAAAAGHTGAMINWALIQYSLDHIFYDNVIDKTDAWNTAWSWMTRASNAGDLRARYFLSAFKDAGVREPLREAAGKRRMRRLVEGSRLEAERNEREVAEAGLPRAQYLHGWQLIRDERAPEGWTWLKKAYANGERIAGFDLYRIARYIWKDNEQAIQYLQSTAEEGELASVQLLSWVHGRGELGQAVNQARSGCYTKVLEQHANLSGEERQDLALPGLIKRCGELN